MAKIPKNYYWNFKNLQTSSNNVYRLSHIIYPLVCAGSLYLSACQQTEHNKKPFNHFTTEPVRDIAQPPNTLNEEEKAEGWSLLFDGQTTQGWRGYNLDTFPLNDGWKIEDGALCCMKQDRFRKNSSPDIITKQKFRNFELLVDWMVGDKASSGIFIFVVENENIPLWKSALKIPIAVQILNAQQSQVNEEERANKSLYLMMPLMAPYHITKGSWNQTRIIVYQGKVSWILNGEKILEWQLWTTDWEKLIKRTNYKGLPTIINPGGDEKMGNIGLQYTGTEVRFRNIKIRVID